MYVYFLKKIKVKIKEGDKMTFGGIIEKYYSFVFELRTNKKSTIAAELERMSEECEGINQGDDQIPDKITSIIRFSLAHADPISDLQFNRIVENKDRSVKITQCQINGNCAVKIKYSRRQNCLIQPLFLIKNFPLAPDDDRWCSCSVIMFLTVG